MLVVALVITLFAAVTARLFVWPSLPSIPGKVDAVVELGGPADAARDQVAVTIAREHGAKYLVQSTVRAEAGTHRCLPPVGSATVLCFHAAPNTTRGEAQYIGHAAHALGWRSVVLVTTDDQAWRARLRVSRCFAGPVYVATASLPLQDWFRQIPYQWVATAKALTTERTC